MRVIGHVALNVFRESVRDRVLYALVVFAVVLMSASFLIGQLTAGQDIKIIKDLGLAAIAVFGILIAIFIGIGLVWKEVERRSIYALLAKPLSRSQFIVGKFAGLTLTLMVNVATMTLAFYAILAWLDYRTPAPIRAAMMPAPLDPHMLAAIVLIAVELMLLTAIALFFSTFSTPFLSAVLTLALWVAGHFNADLRNFERVTGSPLAVWLTRAVYYVLPNFAAFDVKAQVVHGIPVPLTYLAWTIAYGLTYLAMVLVGAVTIFGRRDFK